MDWTIVCKRKGYDLYTLNLDFALSSWLAWNIRVYGLWGKNHLLKQFIRMIFEKEYEEGKVLVFSKKFIEMYGLKVG